MDVSLQSSKRRSGTGQPRSAITWMGLLSAIGTFFELVIGTYKYTRAVALHAALEIKLPGKSFSLQQQASVLRDAVWLYERRTAESSVLHSANSGRRDHSYSACSRDDWNRISGRLDSRDARVGRCRHHDVWLLEYDVSGAQDALAQGCGSCGRRLGQGWGRVSRGRGADEA